MKHTRYNISFYIIIPMIFAGIAAFSASVIFRITEGYLKQGSDWAWPIAIWAAIIAAAAFLCGLGVVWLILRPLERFLKKAKQLPLAVRPDFEGNKGRSQDKLEHFEEVFDQVTEALSKVEARQLFPEIIGQSRAIRGIFSQIMKVAPTDTTVLVSGESGTGKELVATGIHKHSIRKGKPCIKINCVAIPEGLLESELFGHEKGSFTGAIDKKQGKFEAANGGTLILDEIGDMSLNTQAKILRVLQEREFERVGGTRPIKVDVRFIAITNKNLPKMVEEGQFREDLFYRLNVFSIHIPPLRERKGDIPLMVDHFLQKAPNKSAQVSSLALQMLMGYSWPGNVRELQNGVERAAVMCKNSVIDLHYLPQDMTNGLSKPVITEFHDSSSIDKQLREIEQGMIVEVLRKTGGFQVRAAELLGINQRSLWHRIKKYNIDIRELRNQKM